KNDLLYFPYYLVPLIAILLYYVLSMVWTSEKVEASDKLFQMISFCLIVIFIGTISRNININVKRVLLLYILSTISIGFFTYNMNIDSANRFTISEEFNPTWFAAFIVWALVSSVKVFQESKLSLKFFIIVTDLLLIILLLLTQGRNAILAFTFSSIIIFLIYKMKNKIKKKQKINFKYLINVKIKKNILSVISVITLVKTFSVLLNNISIGKDLNRVADLTELVGGDSSKATAGRTTIWKNYLDGLDEKNVFGAGIRSSKSHYNNVSGLNMKSQFTHNNYLLMLIEQGVIGFVLWLLFLILILKKSWEVIKEIPSKSDGYILLWISLLTIFMSLGND